ncbi:hypothetical protein DAPPUDRAFT_235975 [Daphnia pulex]|uniref:Tudor domain-containing protein n=1 Tax=Daphnia pulex TaxID=6669 RepID=E9FZL0_DAPPU|nr:hypothetical protein DAPPUDRAFT_235975 [Daphnia pulex]|eukprot:EFX87075.1 hypothetical protein DAPPUDRAFT_235975 [Daphnia pulex]
MQNKLETRSPPLNVNELDNKQICCVLINKEWHRARVPESKLSPLGTLQVFCVDSGKTYSLPLSFVRTVMDLAGIEADHIRQWPPLATKFILADLVGPRGPGSGSQWSIPAMFFLKTHLENRTWKAVPLGIYAGHQGVRLFDSENKLFVASMIKVELGVPSQTYQDALTMSKVLNEQPTNIKPVLEPLLEPELDMTPASPTPTKTASNFEYFIRSSPVKHKIPLIPDDSTVSSDSLANLLAGMNTSSSDFCSAPNAVGSVNLLASTKTPQAPFSTPQANPTTITEIPDVDLAAQEILFVIFSGEPGSFFGKLGRIPIKDQDEMATELLNVYSSLLNAPLLYVDGKSRLGHHGVLQWNEDQNYHRFRRVLIISELPDGLVEIYFIDYGNSLWIPRLKILAPLDCLNHFRQPPHGIHCKMDGNFSFTASEWKSLVLDKWVEVNVGECKEGGYTVTFTDNSINKKVADVVRAKATPASITTGKGELYFLSR